MKHVLEQTENLCLFQCLVDGLILENGKCVGVKTSLGIDFFGKSIVVTTGTFLRALMHVGQNQSEGGRMGDHVAKGLSADFQKAGIELGRFKTGTPPRILGRTIDFEQTEIQHGDEHPTKFAFYDTRTDDETFHVERKGRWFHVERSPSNTEQITCRVTRTNEKTASIIRDNLHLSPLYKGDIEGTGPRYCPSIEDKIVRFTDKDSHRIYLEPEGVNTDEWYINGLSTSLPFDTQRKILHSIPGLENVIISRPAYAVEYDYANPTQLSLSLESQKIESLFFAGQINGTSGYEEAAAQGLVAGANAALKPMGMKPLEVGRDSGYVGVLISDLVTKGTNEPYRMFTSRAEHRLLFNHGSAEIRYLEKLNEHNLVSASRLQAIRDKSKRIHDTITHLNEVRSPDGRSFADFLRRDGATNQLPQFFQELKHEERDEILYRVKYDGYLSREISNVQKLRDSENIRIPKDFIYSNLPGLKNECAEKLSAIRPETLAQASRISGVDPSAISVLMIMIQKQRKSGSLEHD